MEEKLRYLSPLWKEAGFERLKTEIDPEKMHNVTTSMVDIYENCPGGGEKYLYLACEEGKVTDFQTGEGEAPQAEFSIRGPYQVFAAITRGELSSTRALMTGKLRLKGNMAKAVRLAPLADRVNKVLSGVFTLYEEEQA
ncbi:MAG: SCP2 sterol-binding domain-containing protein [Sphaerochaeta sp.]